MSTNTRTQQSTDHGGIIERYRERWFFTALIVGVATFALGMAFTILAISMNTSPPAPYFASATERYMTGIVAVGFMIAGVGIVRLGAKIGGW